MYYTVYLYLDKDNLNRQHYVIGDIFRLKLLNAVDCQPARFQMDLTEDLSARVLLKRILSTEPPRTPVTRR